MNKKKIMHLNDSLDMGGAEMMILSVLKALDRALYSPSVCSMLPGVALRQEFEESGIPVHVLHKKSGVDWGMIVRLSAILRREKIDILHTHNYYAWFYGGIASLFAPGCKHVHTQHSNIVMYKSPPWFIKRIISAIPRKITAVSDQVLETLLGHKYISNTSNAVIIHNGIDLHTFYPADSSHSQDNNRIVIGIVARLSEVKNHRLLINAFAEVCRDISVVSLKIVGDGPLMADLKEQADNLGISERIEFAGEQANVNEILRQFDIFVLCSYSEGFSMSILEAMATGLPVIATNVGGNPSNVIDKETGLLVESDNISELSNALKKLISDEAMRKRLGNNGRDRVTRLFSLSSMVNGYQNVYDNI